MNKLLTKMVYCAIFIALTYVGTFVNINLGLVGMLHLGNFVAVLASLLFGGLVGGISGSLGMGLYDLFHGYPISTWLRTFIVKFVFCFFVGLIFDLLNKKEKKYRFIELCLASLFLIIGTITMTLFIVKPEYLQEKNINLYLLLIASIMSYVFTILFVILFVLYDKFNNRVNNVIIASTIGIIVNIILEYYLRSLFLVILSDYELKEAFIVSSLKLPASTINGIITITIASLLYYPIYQATKNLIKK